MVLTLGTVRWSVFYDAPRAWNFLCSLHTSHQRLKLFSPPTAHFLPRARQLCIVIFFSLFYLAFIQMAGGSRGAQCSNTPLTQSISPVTDRTLSPPPATLSLFLILPTSFPFQFSLSISGHLFYLNYFREIAALQSRRQSPSRFPGPL